jgi:hypothetical protein
MVWELAKITPAVDGGAGESHPHAGAAAHAGAGPDAASGAAAAGITGAAVGTAGTAATNGETPGGGGPDGGNPTANPHHSPGAKPTHEPASRNRGASARHPLGRDAHPVSSGAAYRLSFAESPRGRSLHSFTWESAVRFLARNAVLTIVRGHEVKRGYEISRDGPLFAFPATISLWSAPDVGGAKNAAAVLCVAAGKIETRVYSWAQAPMVHPGSGVNDVDAEDCVAFARYRWGEHVGG